MIPSTRQLPRILAVTFICLLLALFFFHVNPLNTLQSLPETSTNHVTSTVPTLGKVTLVIGQDNTIYEKAVDTHIKHARRHGHAMFVHRQPLVQGEIYWSKPAYLLSILLAELGKPEDKRLQWLLWVDSDTIVLNPNIPATAFLPVPGHDQDLHLLISSDFNAINDGVFFVRVHTWSVDFLSALMAYRHFNPNTTLFWHEQSAMINLLEDPAFGDHALQLPWRWFNAYDAEALQHETEEIQLKFHVRPGDFLVHLAGVGGRAMAMSIWMNKIVERHDPAWEVDFDKTSYGSQVVDFWEERYQRTLEASASKNAGLL